jgi:hypothetical protein
MDYSKESSGKSRVESHKMGGMKIEHHHDNDMHSDHHKNAYGHMDMSYNEMHKAGGHKAESRYSGISGLPRGEVKMMENSGGGRMSKQHKQDDTVYGKMPPRPGKIDS